MKESIKNKFNLEGKVAIITGASKGIGKSIAKGFIEFGAKVVISSRDQNSLEEVAKELWQENILPIQCHVGKDKDIIKKAIISYHLNLFINHCCVAAVKTNIPINEVAITSRACQILSTPINKSS